MTMLLLAAAFTVETAVSGGVKHIDTVEFQERDGVVRFVWPKAKVPADVQRITITPDFATARKGEPGYWVFPNNAYGTFKAENGHVSSSHMTMPIFGMKTPRCAFWAMGTGMKHSMHVEAVAKDGAYAVRAYYPFTPDWMGEVPDRPYEDFAIEFRFLSKGEDDYSGMARAYRSYQLGRGACRPLAERAKERPELAYAARCPEVRIRQAWKQVPSPVPEQVVQNEPPVKPVVTFDRVCDIVDESRRQGIVSQELCLVGWNVGGHDGRFPQIFPVEPTLGGEDRLKNCIRHAQETGYQIVGHGSFRDCYMIADTWDSEYVVEKNSDGTLRRGKLTWGGGRLFTMCPQRAYERFCPKQCAEMAALGFRGLFYIDVATSRSLYPCLDPRHPLNSSQRAVWEANILNELTRTFGGAASEGGFDFCIGSVDSALTIQWAKPFDVSCPEMVDRYVPFWQLVYHGIVLSTPFRTMINCTANPDRRYLLKLAEFGGRPTYYWHSWFVTGRPPSMGTIDLEATTDEKRRQSVAWVKEGCDEYGRRNDLQFCFMDRHEVLRDGLVRITYSNGAKMLVNYNSEIRKADGVEVAGMSYSVVKTHELNEFGGKQ